MQQMKRDELLKLAGSLGIPGRHKMKKDALVAAISAAQKEGTSAPAKKAAGRSSTGTSRKKAKKSAAPKKQPAEPAPKAVQPVPEIPRAYIQTTITAMARDPLCIHCYWQISPASAALRPEGRTVLRVHDITGIQFYGNNSHDSFDLAFTGRQGSRYITVQEPGRTYCVEIGLITDEGYRCLARSGSITTPRPRSSDRTDPDWHVSDQTFAEIYKRSGGDLRQVAGSPGLLEYVSSPGPEK